MDTVNSIFIEDDLSFTAKLPLFNAIFHTFGTHSTILLHQQHTSTNYVHTMVALQKTS